MFLYENKIKMVIIFFNCYGIDYSNIYYCMMVFISDRYLCYLFYSIVVDIFGISIILIYN